MKAYGKKVTVLGLGKTGFESAAFLLNQGFEVFVSDQGESEAIQNRARLLLQQGAEVETGRHCEARILSSDWILISPGIPPTSSLYQTIRRKGIPLYSEIEVASWFSKTERVIAVTGSAGKTTVTTLIARVLQKKGESVVTCGNIGNPWIGELARLKKNDFLVLEVSSFQLQHCDEFRPHVGILLNLSPNHQDWHADMNEYIAAKLKLFQNQRSSDYALFRKVDQKRFFSNHAFRAQTLFFDEGNSLNPNEAVVHHVGRLFRCKDQDIESAIRAFEGIEHRLEKVAVIENVTYINDSKATTCASLLWALEKFPDGKVILLAGGHPKSNDFADVRDGVSRKVKQAILIGEARPLLREAWSGICSFRETDDFRQAVIWAHQTAAAGDIVLLSPACASFDMFKNYEERGKLFKLIVKELTEGNVIASPEGAKQSAFRLLRRPSASSQ